MSDLLIERSMSPEADRLSGLLSRSDVLVSYVAAGAELVAQATALGPELVILSDRARDPWPAIVELLRTEETRRTRIVLVTSTAIDRGQREALSGAGVRLLYEPVETAVLAETIADILAIPLRATLRSRVCFEVQGRGDSGVFYGRALDISTGGLCMESGQSFALGDEIYCFFTLSEPTPVVFASARIVRVRALTAELFEYGVEFIEMRIEDRLRIAEHVLPDAVALSGRSTEVAVAS